jgi:MFS transporter, DHA3 family, macrolide efflux protein
LAITWIISAIFGMMLVGVGQVWVLWALGGFVTAFVSPTLNGSNQSLWMSKVPPQLQGRVFSIRRLLAQVVGPLGMFIAGPLADRVFEPAMRADGALAPIFGGIFGVGAGAGMGLLITIAGALCIISTSLIYLVPIVRHVETLIPDFETELQEAPAT